MAAWGLDAGAETDLSRSVLSCAHVPIPIRRRVPRCCISKVFAPSVAIAHRVEARLPLLPALAGTLTAFVASIDAFANQPTSKVIVVDPATYPALARSVDDIGRITYQNSVTRVPQATSSTFNNSGSASIPFLFR